MDTRYWGPSGWELFHLIAFRSPHPDDVLNQMKDVLPCKYCRASTTQFVQTHPLRGDPGKWLYEIHNMVNNKLRTQCASDPKVVDPGPDPAFEKVKAKYGSQHRSTLVASVLESVEDNLLHAFLDVEVPHILDLKLQPLLTFDEKIKSINFSN